MSVMDYVRLGAVLAAVLATTGSASAEPSRLAARNLETTSPFMRVFGATAPPFGFVRFCESLPSECQSTGRSDTRIEATPARLSELDEINRRINAAIEPATDMEIYGVQEHWTLPVDRGDCEDYALLKRQILMSRGWPASALLMTVVRDERGDGHAVLTVRTAQGDYVLDNKVQEIKLWHRTGYRYVMRQSYVDPRLWMSLMPEGIDRAGTLTSQPAPRR